MLVQPARSPTLLFVACLILSGASLLAQNPVPDPINCSDPLYSLSPLCRSEINSTSGNNAVRSNPGSSDPAQTNTTAPATQRDRDSQQVYIDSGGADTRRRNNQNQEADFFPPDPITDFQRLARTATGELLPVFGRDLFQRSPSTFAPADQIPVTSDYVIGPGDQILVRLWGPESFNSQLTVDTSGSIYIPRVGSIHVAGLRYDELQNQIGAEVSHIFRNYRISVNLGQLRSIQVYIVGEARRPGAYTISALSTVLNALFVSGGPNVQGSLRQIKIRREGQQPAEFDLYNFVLSGDKSKDIRLQQGDTIFIPAVGPQVALAGSVRHPAVYEIRGETSIADLLQLAGGYTATAAAASLSVERIDPDNRRHALSISNTAEARAMTLRDGDVLFVNHISPGYDKSVTIRGNLANPGRFPWHPGMRLTEIIPDRTSLLTNGYWRERNRLGVPVPLFDPLENNRYSVPNTYNLNHPNLPNTQRSSASQEPGTSLESEALRSSAAALALQSSQLPSTGNDASQTSLFGQNATPPTSPNMSASSGTVDTRTLDGALNGFGPGSNLQESTMPGQKIQVPAPEIDWSYAVIERLDEATLKSVLLPFNLGKLVQDHDPNQNLELQPGDIVTILSQADIPVPLDDQTKFIRLEGEFVSAGVYSVHTGESLVDVVQRAGGLTSKAYLYGSSFLRISTRLFQQQRLDEYISTLSADMERAAAVRAASSTTGILDPYALNEQRGLITQLRQLRATGRIVLEFRPESSGVALIPSIPLENGDVFRIPSRPNTVSVIGAVYGQNVFLFDSRRKVEDYITLAGSANRVADPKHAFIIRADGSIFSREHAQGFLSNNFTSVAINPGDSIVIPEKLIKPSALRGLLDYSQILSSFGLAAAAINVVR